MTSLLAKDFWYTSFLRLLGMECIEKPLASKDVNLNLADKLFCYEIVYRKSPTGQDFAENIKHKVWLKVGLDAVEIVKSKLSSSDMFI